MRKSSNNLPPPPWMTGNKEINGQTMLVVHMKPDELEGLDNLQHGASLDPDTGIREYSALGPIIEIPEVREIFHHVNDEMERHGDISPDLKKIYSFTKQHDLPYVQTPEEKHEPLKSLEKLGRGGDKPYALLPINLVEFLIDLHGGPSINPATGLLEFGKFWKKARHVFKNIIPIAATLAGAFIGGPIGAGLGNTAGQLVTGRNIKTSAMRGLKTGALAYGAQGLGQAAGLTGATPMTGSFFGGSPNLIAKGLGAVGIGSAATPSTPTIPGSPLPGSYGPAPIGGIPQIGSSHVYAPPMDYSGGMGGMGGYAAPAMLGAGAGMMYGQTGMNSGNQAPPSTWDKITEFIKNVSPLAPLAQAGLAYKGGQQEEKREKKHSKAEKEELERERRRMGFYDKWEPIKFREKRYNPKFHERSELERRYGVFPEPSYLYEGEQGYAKGGLVRSYNKGTLVKGPGKGQADEIKTSVPSGSYFIDASSTSMFGDGSTKAGGNVLRQFEEHIRRKFPKHLMKDVEKIVSKTSEMMPVWLSDGEYKFDPITVTALGKGSNEKGASILKDMVNNLRKHKSSKGSGLPPKAKHPSYYIGGKVGI